MEKVSKEVAQQVTTELHKDIEKVLAKHGLELSKVLTKYGNIFSIKVEAIAVEVGQNGVNLASVEAQTFLMSARYMGVKNPEKELGSVVSFEGRQVIIKGLSPNARRNNVLVKEIKTGRDYWVSPEVLKSLKSYEEIKSGVIFNNFEPKSAKVSY
ncbi:hypothetical protein UFOVP688_38 [uncultured Caudovirales phage]|uniref:Uncharacterized protein n=1 Tax=uncultured Caudovirales phage TaxID=2100421 RepID=A0A6J5NJK1_9CAUD|nr:hypothetical protein UFOVP688_38 [uncultured Caudovirales phage]